MSGTKRIGLNPPLTKDLKKITKLVGEGYTQVSIARSFAISHQTWNKRKKDFPKIQEAVDDGKLVGEELVLGKFWNMINDDKHKGHVAAVFIYMKAQMGWNDRGESLTPESTKKRTKFQFPK